jgi:cell division protein FtsW
MTTEVSESRTDVAAGRWSHLGHPMALYYWLLGATALLLGLGLAMVLSASSYKSQAAYNTPYYFFERQLLFAAIGVFLLWVVSRIPEIAWRRSAWLIYGLAFTGLVAVLVIGVAVHGQKNWISLGGPLRFQPSEFAKLALVVWGAAVLTMKQKSIDTWSHILVPVLPGGLVLIGLVAAEGDLGTAMIMMPILFALFYAAGAPMRLFLSLAVAGLTGIAVLSLTHGYRLGRFQSWLNPAADPNGKGYQVLQGKAAMGSGGLFGVGLGASRGKWGWLPEAHTDFIFAVVGEELGLIGTLLVLSAFACLAVCMIVLARRTNSVFTRIAAIAVCAWILGQALVNIGAVVGLLPVTGIPLPLVSYGGSSLIPALLALGLVLGLARHEPNSSAKRRLRSKAVA